MPLCKLSSDSLNNAYTILDNNFITEYMPDADDIAVKVYLYGLLLCTDYSKGGNSIESMSLALGISQNDVRTAIKYWESLGVIHVLTEEPLSYEYLPLKETYHAKKYDKDKYTDFIRQLESMILGRSMTPNEIMRYVEAVEECKIKPDAMLMIVGYCIRHKGNNINTNYILTVARAWVNEGANTVPKVEQKIQELESNNDEMRQVFATLGLRSSPDYDDKQTFIKWTDSWGYNLNSVLYAAKLCKKRGGMRKLDSLLNDFYRKGIYTLAEMQNHAEYIDYTYNLAISINKKLGVYYETVEPVVEGYIIPWLNKKYDGKGLLTIASYCFARTVKSLEGMNNIIDKMYDNGIVSNEAIDEYLHMIAETDRRIKGFLTAIGSSRNVTQADRDYYSAWHEKWGFDDEIISLACAVSNGVSHSLAYVNRILSDWHSAGLKTLEQCQEYSHARQNIKQSQPGGKEARDVSGQRTYTKEELESIYGDLEESMFDF